MDLIEKHSSHAYRHPWELSRADSVLGLLSYNLRGLQCADIGAGDQYFARRLAHLTNVPVYAVDSHYPSTLNQGDILQRQSLHEIPEMQLDLIFLMDVLEHIEKDEVFLMEAVKCLRLGGTAVITVPAHPLLFSSHDVFLKHYRRYTAGALIHVISSCGLVLRELFYFYSPLLVVRAAQRLFQRKTGHSNCGVGAWNRPSDDFVTRSIRAILNLDFKMNRVLARKGMPTAGLSLCAIVQTASV